MAEGHSPVANSDALARSHMSFGTVLRSWGRWWHMVIRDIDQHEVIERRREEAYMSGR